MKPAQAQEAQSAPASWRLLPGSHDEESQEVLRVGRAGGGDGSFEEDLRRLEHLYRQLQEPDDEGYVHRERYIRPAVHRSSSTRPASKRLPSNLFRHEGPDESEAEEEDILGELSCSSEDNAWAASAPAADPPWRSGGSHWPPSEDGAVLMGEKESAQPVQGLLSMSSDSYGSRMQEYYSRIRPEELRAGAWRSGLDSADGESFKITENSATKSTTATAAPSSRSSVQEADMEAKPRVRPSRKTAPGDVLHRLQLLYHQDEDSVEDYPAEEKQR
mmetsp:Transcript_48712/g.114112  ORF Transcript_48712/g.114112 Transcript_48712/m.114112 type:complete len:274 (+) Transcript_48712:61-882(+)